MKRGVHRHAQELQPLCTRAAKCTTAWTADPALPDPPDADTCRQQEDHHDDAGAAVAVTGRRAGLD
ncbi:hypothetical protein DIPPA_07675 [Diplonema papillatum]|nr:hypothetical protein DIPPA_07675 [Diplonema papillatum]